MSADRLDSAARERLDDLLADRAVQGLSLEQQAELDRLMAMAGADDATFDLAAAAATLAFDELLGEPQHEPLSAALRAKLLASGLAVAERERAASFARRPNRAAIWSGWLAAAAALVLAIVAWWPKLAPGRTNLVAMRQALIDTENDEISKAFEPGPDPEGKTTSGDLVWSEHAQRGYLRIAGLPKNDPTKSQYQLWIFDAKQDERYPIDGGVFDVDAATGQVIVPIDARLRVVEPKLFAVTIEKPGGVVVSARERVVALAQL
jgi:anti-sigma-K factor RskA